MYSCVEQRSSPVLHLEYQSYAEYSKERERDAEGKRREQAHRWIVRIDHGKDIGQNLQQLIVGEVVKSENVVVFAIEWWSFQLFNNEFQLLNHDRTCEREFREMNVTIRRLPSSSAITRRNYWHSSRVTPFCRCRFSAHRCRSAREENQFLPSLGVSDLFNERKKCLVSQ